MAYCVAAWGAPDYTVIAVSVPVCCRGTNCCLPKCSAPQEVGPTLALLPCFLASSRPPPPPSKLPGLGKVGLVENPSAGCAASISVCLLKNPTMGFSEDVVRAWWRVIDLPATSECRWEEERDRERLERSKERQGPRKPLQDREQPGFLDFWFYQDALHFLSLGSKNITAPSTIWASLNRFLFPYSGS